MQRDKLKELLGEAATDELVDAIMAANGKDVNAAKSGSEALRRQLEEATSKVSELTEAANAKLTDEEKLQRELEKANAARDAAIRSLNEQSAVAVFAGAGIGEEDYKPFLGSIVTTDQATTTANAKAIAGLVTAKVTAAREQAGKDALGGMKPPAPGNPSGGAMTKTEFDKLSFEKQLELKNTSPELFKQMIS